VQTKKPGLGEKATTWLKEPELSIEVSYKGSILYLCLIIPIFNLLASYSLLDFLR
jgi:hypothetical protein